MTTDELREALSAAGVSQMELARRLGVDGRTVRYWLAGRPMTADIVRDIRKALKPRKRSCPKCGHSW